MRIAKFGEFLRNGQRIDIRRRGGWAGIQYRGRKRHARVRSCQKCMRKFRGCGDKVGFNILGDKERAVCTVISAASACATEASKDGNVVPFKENWARRRKCLARARCVGGRRASGTVSGEIGSVARGFGTSVGQEETQTPGFIRRD